MVGHLIGWACGCIVALAWSSSQVAVAGDVELEPARVVDVVHVVLVSSDGSPVSSAIDRATGGGGFSHCYIDAGHRDVDGGGLIVDYQPGAGVHYAPADRYDARDQARVRLVGPAACELWGCVRSRIGQPFDAAGIVIGRATLATCSGLVASCLPPAVRGELELEGEQISPNALARYFGARIGETVTWEG